MLPAPLLHEALAATAGTLFEAAPFVLAVALVRAPAMRWAAALLGCGCGRGAGAAALSLPAAALCWSVFGPWIALARFGAALALHARDAGLRLRTAPDAEFDGLAQLCTVGVCAWFVAVAMALPGVAISSLAGAARHGLPGAVAIVATGAIIGGIAPCATAAVAMAAMLRGSFPQASLAILMTAGLVPQLHRRGEGRPAARRNARAGYVSLASACLVLGIRGGAGFVHPRLLPLIWMAVPAALAIASRRPATSARFSAVPGTVLLVALVFGSRVPHAPLGTSPLDDLYPGKPVHFTGTVQPGAHGIALTRYAITCCRADATAIVLPTDLTLHVRRGAWLDVRGDIAEPGDVLHVEGWRTVPPPADPYLYR